MSHPTRWQRAAFAAVLAATLVSCGNPATPTPPAPTTTTTPPTPTPPAPEPVPGERTVTISGTVSDNVGARLATASVEISSASGSMVWSGTTDADGRFQTWATAAVGSALVFRYTKEGYSPSSRTISVRSSGEVSASSTLIALSPVSLAGRWGVTIGVNASCPAFPEGFGERR